MPGQGRNRRRQNTNNPPRKKSLGQSNQLAGLSRQKLGPNYAFRRTFQETISGNAAGIVAYTPLITLAKLPSNAEFTNLFTEYRFASVTIVFRPVQSTFSLIGPTAFPVVNTVSDYQDVNSLPGLTAALQYPSWKQNTFSQQRPCIQYTWAPRVRTTATAAVGTGSALLPAQSFLTVSNTDVEHVGFKSILEEFFTGVQIQVTVICDFVVRGPK